MAERVWVEGWQIQCCGEPFELGDTVTWTLSAGPDVDRLSRIAGRELASTVTAAEDRHGVRPEGRTATGIVVRIRAVGRRSAPRADLRACPPVPGDGTITELDRADGWESEMEDAGVHLFGYVVDLEVRKS